MRTNDSGNGLPQPLSMPSGNPVQDLGQAPDRGHFLYALSCVSLGISVASGIIAAILRWIELPGDSLMILLALMAGGASLFAFIFGMFAYYARKEAIQEIYASQQKTVAYYEYRIQELEDEREPLAERARAKGISEAMEIIKQAEQSIHALWTPEIVSGHVFVKTNSVAFHEKDRDTGKPIVLIDWFVACVAKVPCDVFITGGTCTFFTLPAPGNSICRLNLKRFTSLFDGRLAPNEVILHKITPIELSDEEVAALHLSLSGSLAARCLITLDGTVKTATGNCPLELANEQPLVEFRPWLKTSKNPA